MAGISINDRILRFMKNNPEKWMSANEIDIGINYGNSRSIGGKLRYLIEEHNNIEYKEIRKNGNFLYIYHEVSEE